MTAGRSGRALPVGAGPGPARPRRGLAPSAPGTASSSWSIFPTVSLHAVGGDQVLLCRVVCEPGTTVRRHSHEATEQAMWIVDGALTMTVEDETRGLLAGVNVVVNRGSSTSGTLRTG